MRNMNTLLKVSLATSFVSLATILVSHLISSGLVNSIYTLLMRRTKQNQMLKQKKTLLTSSGITHLNKAQIIPNSNHFKVPWES